MFNPSRLRLGLKLALYAAVAQMALCLAGAPAQATPTNPLPFKYAQICNSMGTAAITILAGPQSATGGTNCSSGTNTGSNNNITVCASGCSYTSLPTGAIQPTVFYGAINVCNQAQTAATTNTFFDNTTNSGNLLWQTGTFGAGQISTMPLGGFPVYVGITVTLSNAEPAGSGSNCSLVILFN